MLTLDAHGGAIHALDALVCEHHAATLAPITSALRTGAHLVHLCVCVAIHVIQDVCEEGGVASQGGRVLLRQREQHLQAVASDTDK